MAPNCSKDFKAFIASALMQQNNMEQKTRFIRVMQKCPCFINVLKQHKYSIAITKRIYRQPFYFRIKHNGPQIATLFFKIQHSSRELHRWPLPLPFYCIVCVRNRSDRCFARLINYCKPHQHAHLLLQINGLAFLLQLYSRDL